MPPYRVDKDPVDQCLKVLGDYLLTFVTIHDVRHKIKVDFGLDQMFDENKQTKAFKKIADSHNTIMKEKETAIRQAVVE